MSKLGKLTLRNYRCFNWDNPAMFTFDGGFTALVGQNNSGKSSALRAVYELRNFFSNIYTTLLPTHQFQLNTNFLGVSDVSELANDANPRKFQFELEIPSTLRATDAQLALAFRGIFEYDIQQSQCIAKSIYAIDQKGNEIVLDAADIRGGDANGNMVKYATHNLLVDYSQLKFFGLNLSLSKYFPAFRNAINEGAANYYDIPVGTALVGTWDTWKAGNLRAQKLAISRVEEEIARLLGFKSLQINADQTGKTLDVNIDGRPHKLYEVGAGVAQLIIVLAAALIQKPPYILIDEPELSLHPTLQLNFLSTLGSYAQIGVLYSTHSIGLARSTAKRILTTYKLENGSSKMEVLGEQNINFAEWLGELSYSGRVELGCEGIVLVEGPTDVLLFQEFLRKIQKDSKYVVMQLGGSSLINSKIAPHIAEIIRIIEPSKIHIFIDSEKKSADEQMAKDREDFISECKKMKVNVQASERRATENYFEAKGILAALGEGYKKLEPYQLLKNAENPWNKSDNWRIARETEFADIKETDFGKFLESL
jgi:ABC-type cobalamin/Fe3+-siderophores transport system ATPase subunit